MGDLFLVPYKDPRVGVGWIYNFVVHAAYFVRIDFAREGDPNWGEGSFFSPLMLYAYICVPRTVLQRSDPITDPRFLFLL